MASNIVVIGSSNTDMVIKMNSLPLPGETVMGNTFFTAAGGKGANQAVAAARCGGRVRFIAKIGNDPFGKSAVEGFQRDGIDTSCILMDGKHPSGIAQIWVDANGENSIAVAPGANMHLTAADIDTHWSVIESAAVVLMQLEIPISTVHHVMDRLASQPIKLVLNPAPAANIALDKIKNLFLLTPNETEAALLTGIDITNTDTLQRCGNRLLDLGCKHVIITRGAAGCTWFHREGHQSFTSFKVEAQDTTAAGDVFNGALCVRLAQGDPFPVAIHFASAAAAISVTRNGAQDSAPSHQEIEAFISQRN